MASNSLSTGSFLTKHPDILEINSKLSSGISAQEVSDYLKDKFPQKRYWASPATLTNYRKNVLNLDKEQLKQNRDKLKAEGRIISSNNLSLSLATTDLIEAKSAVKNKIEETLNDFDEMKTVIKNAIKTLTTATVDDMGQPKFVARNFEVLDKLAGRVESISNSFLKAAKDLTEKDEGSGQTNITITTAEINKYKDAFKGVLQRVVTKFDPNLLSDVFNDLAVEFAKIDGQSTGSSSVQVSIDGRGNNQINIITGGQQIQEPISQLPSIEEVTILASEMTNENDYIPGEEEEQNQNQNTGIIETKINN